MPYESSAKYEDLKFSRLHSIPLAFFRIVAFILWSFFYIGTQALVNRINRPWSMVWLLFIQKVYRRILGLQVEVRGKICSNSPCLYVANHSSYLDIIVLGSLVKGSFIAKKEIEKWPFFGIMTKLQHGIFVERKREFAAQQSAEVRDRLNAGDNLMLFPEGTSSDGNRVLPFKSSLFAVVQGIDKLAIQPVSISYVMLNGMPLGSTLRPLVAWYGDMTLMPHLWAMLGLGKIKVVVHFNQPLLDELKTLGRKEIAAVCEKTVAWSHDQALHTPIEMKSKKPKNA